MPVATLTSLPGRIVAGNTLILLLGWADFPATLWNGDLAITHAGGVKVIRATASGTDFLWSPASAETAGLFPGRASVAFAFTESATSQRDSRAGGDIIISPNPAGVLPADCRLATVKAALVDAEAQLKRQSSFGMSGFEKQQTVNVPLPRLMELVARCKVEVDSELVNCGLPPMYGTGRRTIQTVFCS